MCAGSFIFGGAFVREPYDLDAEKRPFVIFRTLSQLEEYRSGHQGDFFNLSDEQYSVYDESFFKGNALLMFLTQGMSGSIRCEAESFRQENNSLYVKVCERSPLMHTMDLHYNTLAIAIPHSCAQHITAVYIESYRIKL